MTISAAQVASCFESLGGGSLNANGWAFGCEFGYFQRELGLEPLGLLRWASISSNNIKNALERGFAGVDDIGAINMRVHTAQDWGVTQTTYGMYMDHTNMIRAEVAEEEARKIISKQLNYLQQKFMEDVKIGEKLFVYRTYDHALKGDEKTHIADALSKWGKATLFYVQLAEKEQKPFTAIRRSPKLIIGYIDRFAPANGQLNYNNQGWEWVCRAGLMVW
jgi:hypothetical protein